MQLLENLPVSSDIYNVFLAKNRGYRGSSWVPFSFIIRSILFNKFRLRDFNVFRFLRLMIWNMEKYIYGCFFVCCLSVPFSYFTAILPSLILLYKLFTNHLSIDSYYDFAWGFILVSKLNMSSIHHDNLRFESYENLYSFLEDPLPMFWRILFYHLYFP